MSSFTNSRFILKPIVKDVSNRSGLNFLLRPVCRLFGYYYKVHNQVTSLQSRIQILQQSVPGRANFPADIFRRLLPTLKDLADCNNNFKAKI